jgi:transposase
MKAYSVGLRERIIEAVEAGTPRGEVAGTFRVSLPTIERYVRPKRETGGLEPRRIPGRSSRKGAALHTGLGLQLQAHPDAYLEEHGRLWGERHGVRVSRATMSRAIKRLGWTPKKRR